MDKNYFLAKSRMNALAMRGDDVEAGTLRRLEKITQPEKLVGLYVAAQERDLKKVVKAVASKYKDLTDMSIKSALPKDGV